MQNVAQDAQFAAEFHADVDAEKIAEVYAKAYLDAVTGQGGSIDDAVAEFASLVDVLKSQPKFSAILASAMVATDEKIALLKKAIAASASPLFWNFLQIVAKRNRLDLLLSIFLQAQSLLNERQRRIPVTITTATEVDSQLFTALSAKLRGILGGKPIIRSVIDPEVLGGLVVRVGDTIYDASVSTQLQNVCRQMIERSAQEIQSRRENFRACDT
ncbi:MAG: ATP synthase F1 subunit delta [Planctomycetaceae bacterium]|nr:ATP synthase F1 subunit delta [Planctomycetaceae bacterium]